MNNEKRWSMTSPPDFGNLAGRAGGGACAVAGREAKKEGRKERQGRVVGR